METLSKIYDEHEDEMLPFFCKYQPNSKEPMHILWARLSAEKYYLYPRREELKHYGRTRKLLKESALADEHFPQWAKERGWI